MNVNEFSAKNRSGPVDALLYSGHQIDILFGLSCAPIYLIHLLVITFF